MKFIANNWRLVSVLFFVGVGAGLFYVIQPVVKTEFNRWLMDQIEAKIQIDLATPLQVGVGKPAKILTEQMSRQQIEMALIVLINQKDQCQDKLFDLRSVLDQ